VKTDHILFIASGAFHLSNLRPDSGAAGALPIAWSWIRFRWRISRESSRRPTPASPGSNQALLATEEVEVSFVPDGIRRLAEIAWSVNEKTENIGARRLYTVMEKLLEEISSSRQTRRGEPEDRRRLRRRETQGACADEDLARYVL